MLLSTILPIVIVKGSVDIWTKLLTGGQKLVSSLRMDLEGELVEERIYRKTLFALRIHTPRA